MKRYYRNLLLINSIFSIVFAFAEHNYNAVQANQSTHAVHKERPMVRVSDTKGAHGISQMSKARAIYGGDSTIRPKGKKNKAIASTTRSTSLALLQVTIVTLVYFFLY